MQVFFIKSIMVAAGLYLLIVCALVFGLNYCPGRCRLEMDFLTWPKESEFKVSVPAYKNLWHIVYKRMAGSSVTALENNRMVRQTFDFRVLEARLLIYSLVIGNRIVQSKESEPRAVGRYLECLSKCVTMRPILRQS